MVKSLEVVEPMEEVTYLSSTSPTLKVVIDNTKPNTPPHYARFSDAQYRTSDPEEIAVLDKCKVAYRSEGRTYTCPICGSFSSPDPRKFGEHMTKQHG
jgi:hypothetical protein